MKQMKSKYKTQENWGICHSTQDGVAGVLDFELLGRTVQMLLTSDGVRV